MVLLPAGFAMADPIQLSPSPARQPVTQPVPPPPGDTSPLSVDAPINQPDYMHYTPYNTFPRELDLWNLEDRRFVRSAPVVAPDRTAFAYTEVMFMPHTRQTVSRLYLAPVPPLPAPPAERLPSEEAPEHAIDPHFYGARFDPDRNLKTRELLLSVGMDKAREWDFRTLTIVDWSAGGRKLLFKQRSGILHVGQRTSDILVYDQGGGTVTIYPEVHRVIEHYWKTHGNLPHINELVWDLQPLGWEPGSDSVVLLKAWAFDKKEKKYLGLWRYNVDARRTQLVSLDNAPATVAANGWLAEPVPVSEIPAPKKTKAGALP